MSSSVGYTHELKTPEGVEFNKNPIRTHEDLKELEAIRQLEKDSERVARLLGDEEPSKKDIEIARVMAQVTSVDYNPRRFYTSVKEVPSSVLKASEAIPSVPRLTVTPRMKEIHENVHLVDEIPDMRCQLCRDNALADASKTTFRYVVREGYKPSPTVIDPVTGLEFEVKGEARNASRGSSKKKHGLFIQVVPGTKKPTYVGEFPSREDRDYGRWYAYELLRPGRNHLSIPVREPKDVEGIRSIILLSLREKGLVK